MVFVRFSFGFAALGMFVVALNSIRKGRLGMAAVFGLMAVLMAGIVGALAVYVD